MKIVYDYDKKCVVKREQEKQFYKDSEFADRIRVYISDPGLPSEQYSYHLAMAFKKPNGRIIAPQYYNGAAGNEAIEIDGVSKNYTFFDFKFPFWGIKNVLKCKKKCSKIRRYLKENIKYEK